MKNYTEDNPVWSSLLTRFAYVFAGVVLLVYVLGRVFFDMRTTTNSGVVFSCCLIILLPVVIAHAIIYTRAEGQKWYGYVGHFLWIGVVYIWFGYFTVMKADLLVSAAIKPSSQVTVPINDVSKYVLRKSGFDHTNVSINYNGRRLTFEASRTSYFLLKGRKYLKINIGQSLTGNYYVTNFDLPFSQRAAAAGAYVKDWAARHWYIAAFFGIVFVFILIKNKFWPEQPGIKAKPMPFWKVILLIMALTFGIGILILGGIVIYIKLFV